MQKKKLKKEEPLPEQTQEEPKEPSLELKEDLSYDIDKVTHKVLHIPVHIDKLPMETREIEELWQMVNIKYNTPKVSYICKTIVYDCKGKKIKEADYQIGVEE